MLLRLLIFTLFLTMNVVSQTVPVEPGVSQALAKWRAANYSDVRYKLNITLEKGAPLMKGDIEIRVNLTEEAAKNDLILDWRQPSFVDSEGKPFAFVYEINDVEKSKITTRFDKEHLIISSSFLKQNENTIKIKFASPIKTSGAAVTRYVDKEDEAEYVYSLFVPSDASTAFPVFDQPDLKARFQLILDTPIDWNVITNDFRMATSFDPVPITSESTLNKATRKKTTFFETKQPISTYVFAFAAGEFERFTDTEECLKIFDSKESNYYKSTEECLKFSTVYVRKSQAEKFKQHAAEVFRLNREAIKYLEEWFDYKFPFPKYDLVLIPEFPFGGMEHAGATFLREDRIVFPTEPTKNDFITRANLIFHEAAHQWFGDTVTMRWFDDLWLKEGFAEFMAYKTLEKLMPEMNAWKVFYERNKQAAYLTDVTRGTTPIYQEIPNLASAKSAYGNIVYRKAPSFLKQAEFFLGEKEFQKAVRIFLKKHEFANARWEDLVSDFARVKYNLPESGGTINAEQARGVKELLDWANGWIKQRGQPIIKLENNSISQKDSIDENSKWIEKFQIYTFEKNANPGYKDSVYIETVLLNQSNQPIRLSPKATFIFPNYQDYGYGIFLLDEKSRAYILENIQNEKDDFLRSMMWGSLWDALRFYELAPEEYVRLVIKNLGVEQDESTIATLLNRVSTAMNYYLTEEQAARFAPEIENLLIEKMNNAPTLGQKITYYRALVSLASTEKARNILKEMLGNAGIPAGNERDSAKTPTPQTAFAGKMPAFQLKTKDKFDIVTKLITLGDPDGLQLLAGLEKQYTDDAAKRYAYAARAGIPTAENKAKYWNDFVNNKQISESWIESAFSVFNTPRHADLTLPYLEKAFAELPNLKRNRKIFFVNGWLSAFIGGQKSAAALKIVNDFLEKNPNLDADLRRKILENADNLERAVKIRGKYEE